MKPLQKLALEQVERRLNKVSSISEEMKVKPGWINYIRKAMCITLETLARESKLHLSTIQKIEKRESSGKVTLDTMRKTASAMECEFVYAFVPKKPISVIMKEKAYKKALRIIQEADVHMTLEGQRVSEDLKKRAEQLAHTLLEKGNIW